MLPPEQPPRPPAVLIADDEESISFSLSREVWGLGGRARSPLRDRGPVAASRGMRFDSRGRDLR